MAGFHFRSIVEWGARTCDWFKSRPQFIRTVGLLLGFVPTLCLSQIVPRPEFDFEKLSWGESLSSVKKILLGRALREQNSEEQFGATGLAMPSSLLLSFEDTLHGNPFRVVLWFSKGEQKLTRVLVALIRPKSSEDKGTTDTDAIQSSAWERLSKHYGSSSTDSSLPLVGKTRMWSFSGTDVFMMSVNSFGKKNFTITYSQNRKK